MKRLLGEVPTCTLIDAQQIEVEGRKYCAVHTGVRTQSESVAHCKRLNARLPLPKSKAEYASFEKIFPNRAWIDITKPDYVEGMIAEKLDWKDSIGNVPKFVKIRVAIDLMLHSL